MAIINLTTQPVASTIFVGTNTTFYVEASTTLGNPSYSYNWVLSSTSTGLSSSVQSGTSQSYGFDPDFSNSGDVYFVSVSALSTTNVGLCAAGWTTSTGARITVIDNPTPPYNTQDIYPESGVARHLRLRNLGYI